MLQIHQNEIKKINGLYVSQLYKDYYAVELVVKRGANYFRIRYPYNIRTDAEHVLAQIRQGKFHIKKPAYKPVIHLMDVRREKVL